MDAGGGGGGGGASVWVYNNDGDVWKVVEHDIQFRLSGLVTAFPKYAVEQLGQRM